MRKIRILSGLLILILAVPALALDKVTVDSVTAYPGGTAVLPIYFENDDPLDAVEVVLEYDNALLTIDSFSTLGSRVEYIDVGDISFVDSAEFIDLWIPVLDGDEPSIPVGSGLLANLYFTTDVVAAGSTFPIDSTRWPGVVVKKVLYSVGGYSVHPDFEKGFITVLSAPPTNDSIWVDSIGAVAGSQAEVLIYCKNEEDVRAIDLSLGYSSANLLYDHVEFDGTRGLAANQTVEANAGLRQIHISLEYGDTEPLAPGTGAMARIVFDVSAAAPSETVVIDSVSYLGVTPLRIHQAISGGGASFVPYFTRGFVDIKLTTDVDDDRPDVLPTEYALFQNTPNPFNPATTIEFDLPRAGHVKLDILNILGQKVMRLVDKEFPAGHHSVIFDTRENGRELATGVYFYRIESDDFKQSKKMLLLK